MFSDWFKGSSEIFSNFEIQYNPPIQRKQLTFRDAADWFHGETSGDVAKCRLFSQATILLAEKRQGGTPLQEANRDVPLDGVAFSRLE